MPSLLAKHKAKRETYKQSGNTFQYDQIWSQKPIDDHWELVAYKRCKTPHRRQNFFLICSCSWFSICKERIPAQLRFKMGDSNLSLEEEEDIRKSFNKVRSV